MVSFTQISITTQNTTNRSPTTNPRIQQINSVKRRPNIVRNRSNWVETLLLTHGTQQFPSNYRPSVRRTFGRNNRHAQSRHNRLCSANTHLMRKRAQRSSVANCAFTCATSININNERVISLCVHIDASPIDITYVWNDLHCLLIVRN